MTRIYDALFRAFGPQHWWPGDTPFEVCTGAILTQNTNWTNVERAIENMKKAGLLEPRPLRSVRRDRLKRLIRPAGYFNQKAERLQVFARWFGEYLDDSFCNAKGIPTGKLRGQLLALNGIGPETADSMLLYAFDRAVFVVDAYTRRITERHGLIHEGATYDELQRLFESNLPKRRKLFNEYHALIVMAGKTYCGPTPRCDGCPLDVKSRLGR
jgi:endonuclease-3 related protein